MLKPVPTKAFLQPAKAADMCTAPCAETRPPPPILPFLLAQNLSSKRNAPTDNMRPKFHDVYSSSVVKGLIQANLLELLFKHVEDCSQLDPYKIHSRYIVQGSIIDNMNEMANITEMQ